MKTKFIENTNGQYSIREDGVVIRNYLTSHSKIVFTSREVKPLNNKVNLNTISGRKAFTITLLLKKYYGVKCKYCENKVVRKYKRLCDTCISTIDSRYHKKSCDKLTKDYIAKTLHISVVDLDETLYNHHKDLILFKRELSKKHNISILTLNH